MYIYYIHIAPIYSRSIDIYSNVHNDYGIYIYVICVYILYTHISNVQYIVYNAACTVAKVVWPLDLCDYLLL